MRKISARQKNTAVIIAAIFLLGMLASCVRASLIPITSSTDRIRVVMDNNYPPYIYLGEGGNARGILVDQWALWEKKTGVKVELSAIHWEDALDGMKNGDYDVIDTIFYTRERAEIYDFTDAYARIDVPIFFHNNISGIAGLDDLTGFRVAVKTGDADAEFLENAGVRDLVYYDSYEEIIQAAKRGDENIFVVDQPPGLYFIYKYGLQSQFNYTEPLFSGEFHRAVKKGDTAVLNLVESGFASISKSEYQAIENRWLGVQHYYKWQEYLPYIQAGALIVLLVIVILVVFNRTLQRRVAQRTQEMKQALADLQKSERRYRDIFDAPTEAIFIQSVSTGRILQVNKSMLKMFGYESEEEVISGGMAGIGDSEPPYSREDAAKKAKLAMEEGPQVFDWLAKKKNGENFWAEVSLRYVEINGEGQTLIVVRDITKRKRAEEALRASESSLREAQEIANIGSYVLNFSTGMWESSAILDRIFGIDDSYIRSVEGWSNLIHPEYRAQMTDYFTNEVAGTHTPFDREYKIIRQNDKAERWLHGLGALEFDGQGKLLSMHGVIQDITERKQAEDALRESEAIYRKMNENSPIGMHFYRLEGNELVFVGSNPAADKLLGMDNSQFVGKTIREAFPPLMQTEAPDRYRDAAAKGIPWSNEQIAYEDGQIKGTFEVKAFQTTPGNMVAVFADVTARKQAEEEMRQRVVELETLYESGLTINRLLDPQQIGQTVIELLTQKLDWHHTTIRLYHPQDESLELLAFNQPGLTNESQRREVADRFNKLIAHSGQGVSGWAVRHKQVVRSNDLSKDPRYVNTYPGLQSGLYVPMMIGERVVGVISIESERPNAFNHADERLAATLANQAASALENARLFEAERKQRQVSEALRDALHAGASMSASLDFETIFDRLLEALERVVPFEGACIMLVEAESQRINIAKLRGYRMLNEQLFQNLSKFSFEISRVENLRWMLDHKEPMIIPDVSQYPGWIRIPESIFTRSWAGAPIIVNDEVIALFSLDSTETNFFSTEHIQLLRAFTGQASLALQNARLFQQTERRLQEFAALYETSTILSGENELTAMLQAIVDSARKLLDTASSGIYLYLRESDELELTVAETPYSIVGTRLKSGEGVAGYVAKNRKTLRLDDYSTWEYRSLKFEDTLFHAVLGVPMLYGGELIGVLMVGETDNSIRRFTEADERLLSLFASQAAGAIHSARLREQTERRLNQLQALHTIDRAISSSFDLHPILNTVITQTIAQLNVDAVDVLLYHPHLQTLEYVAGGGFRSRAIEQTRLRLGECYSGRAAFERRTIHIPSLPDAGPAFTRAAMLKSEEFVELYTVPLIAKGEIKGVLEVFHRTPISSNPEWLDFLETLSKQAAITIDQTQLFDNLQRANLELVIAYDATIEGWARAMDLRDKETESHTERVTELTISLARTMGVRENEILNIRRGALLHDIGKMGIPDNILLKEGKLTDEEWTIMRRHPQFAYEMLQPIKYLRQSFDIPYCHHEKWDGTGYPRGLKGEQIPLAARIFAIADVWDALTSDRPYRKAWTTEKALSYIKEQSGRQFDPKIIEAFLNLIANE